jgi:cytochrome d ubiquinol oxidase subunit II
MNSLALVWLGVIAFIVIMYVILDGFTLGLGLLFPWIKDSHDRDIMISTVLPVWDGNETWLVFAGAALYAGFPEAFGTLLSALYLPLMLLLVGLLLRGVSFEFIHKATAKGVHIWEKCFFGGSLLAVIAQGIFVSNYARGFIVDPVTGSLSAHPWLDWFNLFCVIALIIGYTLLGSARLIKKTSGDLQQKLFDVSSKLQWVLLLVFIFLGVYEPTNESTFKTWFVLYHSPFMIMFVIASILLMATHAFAIKKRIENLPFIMLIGIFIIAYIGFGINNLPYIVPYQLTFMQTKANNDALRLMLYGAAVLLPLLLFYTAYAYHIFGEKVDANKKISY